jgi:hypothetical protein
MGRAALGFKPRTGRAILVVLLRDGAHTTRVIERAEVALLPPGEFAPYHAAEGLAPPQARAHVAASIERARTLAGQAVRSAAQRCIGAGHEVCGCAVLVGNGMPAWSTDEILAVHVRMHQAEGELFREVLVDAARTSGLALTTLPDKTALDAAAQRLHMPRAEFDAQLVALGKPVGPPWGQHQKEAAAAALVALQS